MNFLSMAANKLGSLVKDRMGSPDSAFGRISHALGMGSPQQSTPAGMENPDGFAQGLQGMPVQDMLGPDGDGFAQQNGFPDMRSLQAWRAQRQGGQAQGGQGGNALQNIMSLFGGGQQ